MCVSIGRHAGTGPKHGMGKLSLEDKVRPPREIIGMIIVFVEVGGSLVHVLLRAAFRTLAFGNSPSHWWRYSSYWTEALCKHRCPENLMKD